MSPIELGVNASIDISYVSGLSLTHGLVEQRKHVWTFAGAFDKTPTNFFERDQYIGEYNIYNNTFLPPGFCPCIFPARTWHYKVLSYVGDSYFCETGALTLYSYDYNMVYMNDPLWDGEGCGESSTCCSFNNPPWFCQHLN